MVFNEQQAPLAKEWQQLGRFQAVTRTADGRLLDAAGTQVGSTPGCRCGCILCAPIRLLAGAITA